jgi:hypothetical protein
MKSAKSICSLFLLLGIILLISCPAPVSNPVTHYLTGTILDSKDGTPLAGVNIIYGATNTTTDANGNVSISLGTSGGVVTGDLSIYKTGYLARFLTNMKIDSSKDTDICYALTPLSTASYTKKTISGKIFNSDGVTEIANSTSYMIVIYAGNGQCVDGFVGVYSNGYSGATYIKSSNCSIQCANGAGAGCFSYNIDLSVASPTANLTLQSLSSMTPVATNITFTADQLNNAGAVFINTPFGGSMLYTKSGSTYSIAYFNFTSSTSVTVDLINPFPASQIILMQHSLKTFKTSYYKELISTSSYMAIPASSSTLAFPAIVDNGPDDIPNASSIAYTSGTLSITAVSNANYYNFSISQSGGNSLASVFSQSNSVVLPTWLQTLLSGKTIDIYITIANYSDYFNLENFKYNQGVPNLKCAEISDSSFKKTGILIP